MTNSELITQCLDGDQLSWQQLLDRYARLVHSIPVRLGLTPAEVDDVGQEVFLALAQNLHRIDDPERLSGWLATTTQRISWRVIQKRRREQIQDYEYLADDATNMLDETSAGSPMTEAIPSIETSLETWDRQRAIYEGFAKIDERCRLLLTLIFLDPEEPSYDEISARLMIPKGSIGPTRNRCLQKLRTALESSGFSQTN